MLSTVLMLLAVVAVASCSSAVGTDFYLRSMSLDTCNSTRALAVVKIALGVCLNNHDFSRVPCPLFQKCLGNSTVRYEDLVKCTGAPSMALSIYAKYDSDDDEVSVHIFPISRTCFGIPIPLSYKRYECVSSRFALNPPCGHRGAEMVTPSCTWLWLAHSRVRCRTGPTGAANEDDRISLVLRYPAPS